MAFLKQAQILPTYLFLKPAHGGLSQVSCFNVVFSVGLTQRDNTYAFMRADFFNVRVNARKVLARTHA